MANFDYYNYRIKNVTEKISEEIVFYQGCPYAKTYQLDQYLTYLKSRIGTDRIEMPTMTHYDNLGNKQEIKKMNLDEYVKNIDISTFSRPWNKLKEIHKCMKIKEFIDSLEYNKKVRASKITKNRAYLKEEICAGLKTKKFGKHKTIVDYDQENMNILSISCIDYDKKTHLYSVDWDL